MISIITPVYKSEIYLRRCVDSILAQTYTDIELILVDDGSPDGSGKICDEFAARDKRVKVIHQANAGPSAARNCGLKEARGEYIGFIDSDDYLEMNMFQTLLDLLKETKADIAMCSFYRESVLGQIVSDHGFGNAYLDRCAVISRFVSTYYKGIYKGFDSVCNKLYSADLIFQHQLAFDESRARAEDAFFNLAACAHTHGIVFSDQVLYHYSRNPESIMHTFIKPKLEYWERDVRDALTLNDQCFHLSINLSEFFRGTIIYAVIVMSDAFILKRFDKQEIFFEFYHSEFFRYIIEYDQLVSSYAKVLSWAFRNNQRVMAVLVIKVISLLKIIRNRLALSKGVSWIMRHLLHFQHYHPFQ